MNWEAISEINRLILVNIDKARQELIQLIDAEADEFDELEREIINELLDRVGLYPYFLGENAASYSANIRHAVHSIAFRPDPEKRRFEVLHTGQLEALRVLNQGKNLFLFAPTSFGKTSIAFEFLAQRDFQVAIFIVPTLALMDEVRRDAIKVLECNVYTSVKETIDEGLYVLTQERYLTSAVDLTPDIVFFDEFYKIADKAVAPEHFKNSRDHRSILLNRAWYLVNQTSAQIVALSPTVDSFDPGMEKNEATVLNTTFETVNILDIRIHGDRILDCVHRIQQNEQLPILIYFKSPMSLFNTLAELPKIDASPFLDDYLSWLRENHFPQLQIISALEKGYVAHYGPLPPSIRRHMVRLFNSQGGSSVLLCTATMVEGVNTAAKTVILFDKKVANNNLSELGLRNIRGRAGRMGQHKTGNFVYYDDLSKLDESYIDIPIDVHTSKTSDEEKILSGNVPYETDDRTDFMQYCIRKYPTLRVDEFEALYSTIENEAVFLKSGIFWSGMPNNSQLTNTIRFATYNFLQGNRKTNARDIWKNSYAIWLIKAAVESSISSSSAMGVNQSFFKVLDENLDVEMNREQISKFIFNSFRHGLPAFLTLMSDLIPEIYEHIYGVELEINGQKLNYKFFAESCSKLFTDFDLFELEDIGIPLQLSMKLVSRGVDLNLVFANRQAFLTQFAEWDFLSEVERWILEDATGALK